MTYRLPSALLVILMTTACGSETPGNEVTSSVASTPGASIASGSDLHGIVLRYAPGGHPESFCTPQWSIANQTEIDIPGMLINIEWQSDTGEVILPLGEFGTLQQNLTAGSVADRTLIGDAIACDRLRIVVGSYACRDATAVRKPCPGPVHVLSEGGIQLDLTGLKEGPMRGAMEP